MKPINEMNMEELAAYAVTLDGWDWTICGGMFASGAGRVPDEDVEKLLQMTPEEFEEFKRDVIAAGFRPDLTDPATLGCVLAMARKKYGDQAHTFYDPEMGWGFCDGTHHGGDFLFLYEEEIQALIAALAEEEQ